MIRMTTLVLSVFAASMVFGDVLDQDWIKGTRDKDPIMYKQGEKKIFTLVAQGLNGEFPDGEYFLQWMGSLELYAGDRAVFASQVPDKARKRWSEAAWWKDIGLAGHVVVKVAPGGESYHAYVLDAADEWMRVIFRKEKRCSAWFRWPIARMWICV